MSDCNCKITIKLSDEPCGDGKDFALAQFARNISTADFDALKKMLKDYEGKEYYEYCAVLQGEIDFRVKLSEMGYKPCI